VADKEPYKAEESHFKVDAITAKGGAVTLNKDQGVWVSYAVATVGDADPPEVFYSGLKLKDGRTLQIFINRETNLVVVDIGNKKGTGGIEVFKRKV